MRWDIQQRHVSFLSLAGKACESLMKNGLKCCCRTELNTVKSYMHVHISMPGWKGFPKQSNTFLSELFQACY